WDGSCRASSAQHAARERARGIDRVATVLADHGPVDDHGADAVRVRNESVGTRREIPYTPERRAAYGRRIEDGHVGGEPRRQAPAVGDAEDLGRLRGETAHRLLEREDRALADPRAEQLGGRTGVAQLARVRTRVGESDHGG